MRRPLVVLSGVGLVGLVSLSLAAREDRPRGAQGDLVGSDTCLTCHQDQEASIAKSVHRVARRTAGTPCATVSSSAGRETEDVVAARRGDVHRPRTVTRFATALSLAGSDRRGASRR